MRIALFTSGGFFGSAVLSALMEHHEVVAVVRPQSNSRIRGLAGRIARRLGFRAPEPVDELMRARGVLRIVMPPKRQDLVLDFLSVKKPDALCIAAFPWLLSPTLCSLPRLGGINIHPSLLPRHRGPNPWFWVYYHDDRESGVSAHKMTARADAGDILAQVSFPVERGLSVDQLYARSAECAQQIVLEGLERIETAAFRAIPQDESRATLAPRLRSRTPMVNFREWDVERVWHFLSGLFPQFLEPLYAKDGRRIRYRGVLGYVRGEPAADPGIVTRAPHGWDLACRGGVVRLSGRPILPASGSPQTPAC